MLHFYNWYFQVDKPLNPQGDTDHQLKTSSFRLLFSTYRKPRLPAAVDIFSVLSIQRTDWPGLFNLQTLLAEAVMILKKHEMLFKMRVLLVHRCKDTTEIVLWQRKICGVINLLENVVDFIL